jgi:hypothetical protein
MKKDFINYWNDGFKVMSMRDGYHSELPTVERICSSEKEAQETAHIWQLMEEEEYRKL